MRINPFFRRLAAVGAAMLLAWATPAGAGDELVVFTWSEYVDPDLIAEFEAETGARVKFVYYESDDLRTRAMVESDGRGYDVVVVNGLSISSYVRRGWISPLGELPLSNLDAMESRWRTAFPDAERYAVPYFWGTMGIAYRRDLVTRPLTRWRDLFEPAEELRGRIVMIRSVRDLVGMALKTLGHSANSEDRDAIAAAEQLLLHQKPYVRSYSYLALTRESALITGEAWAAITYSGDALMLKDLDDNIEYVVPEEGSNLWVDYMVVAAASVRRALAARFIEFLNRPDVAARNAQYLHYATPNRAAMDLLPAEFLADRVVFPDADVLARSEPYRELAPRAMKRASAAIARVVN